MAGLSAFDRLHVISLRRPRTWILSLAMILCSSAGPVGARPLERINQSLSDPMSALLPSPAPSLVCQADAANIGSPIVDEQRKQYIRGVLARSKVAGRRLDRTASGFFVSADGNLITTASIVHECESVSVSPMYGEIMFAKVIATEDAAGIALLHADIASPGIATLISSEGAYKRNPVYMLGYPELGSITAEPALSSVRVRNSQQTAFGVSTMLVDGDVRSGYNGGPILDSSGGVIGVVTPGKTQLYGTSAPQVDSMGLAVPSESLFAFLEKSGIDYRTGQQLPPKPADRILIDSRPFAAQIGCWQ